MAKRKQKPESLPLAHLLDVWPDDLAKRVVDKFKSCQPLSRRLQLLALELTSGCQKPDDWPQRFPMFRIVDTDTFVGAAFDFNSLGLRTAGRLAGRFTALGVWASNAINDSYSFACKRLCGTEVATDQPKGVDLLF